MGEIEGPGIGLPARFARRAWLGVAGFAVCGCVASWYARDWEWLARAGALITVVALAVASFNPSLEAKLVVGPLHDTFGPPEGLREDIRAKPHLYGISHLLTEEQAEEVLAREHDRLNTRMRTALEAEFRDALTTLQLRIGVVGTILWGFGNLLNVMWVDAPRSKQPNNSMHRTALRAAADAERRAASKATKALERLFPRSHA